MQNLGYELLRIPLPGTSVNKEQSVVSVDRCILGDQQW